MSKRALFELFIKRLGLRHFTPGEFLVGLDRGNEIPAEEMWGNIIIPAMLCDQARAHFGRPATITSSYRAPAYNASVGGTSRSQHQAFAALDLKVRGVSGPRLAAWFRDQRGRVIESPSPVRRAPVEVEAGVIPFRPLETWARMPDLGLWRVVFAGGVGSYSTFAHVDSRGINSTWRGR